MNYPKTIPVAVDKSQIPILGEKLYAENGELIRVLVNKTFDADAAEVRVEIAPERIMVADDGRGAGFSRGVTP